MDYYIIQKPFDSLKDLYNYIICVIDTLYEDPSQANNIVEMFQIYRDEGCTDDIKVINFLKDLYPENNYPVFQFEGSGKYCDELSEVEVVFLDKGKYYLKACLASKTEIFSELLEMKIREHLFSKQQLVS